MKPQPQFSYPLHALIQKRWSPRAFSSASIDESTILSLFEAGRWAASCMNEQPWRFVYARREDTERFGKLFSCLADMNQVWCSSAAVLVLTLVRTTFERTGKPNRWAYHDLGLAVGNLTTQASALDIYVHNMAGFSVDKARETFSIPGECDPVTMIALGYLGDPEQLPPHLREREIAVQERKAMEDLLLT